AGCSSRSGLSAVVGDGGLAWSWSIHLTENLAWRVSVEPAWTLNRGLSRLSISSTFTAMEVTEDGTEMVAAERKLPPSHRAGSPPARRLGQGRRKDRRHASNPKPPAR